MGTHYRGTPAEERALETYIKLSRAAEAVTNRINRHLHDYGLTVSQFGVLEALYHLGSLHQNQLAEKILKSSGNMTLVIDNLVKQDLVERRRDERDRRYVNVHLTEKGEALIDEIFPTHVNYVVETFSPLSPAEQKTMATLCRKLGLAQKEPQES
jgi:MarR family 2-MHQ and catechol resistance regulon transcriptional repressor